MQLFVKKYLYHELLKTLCFKVINAKTGQTAIPDQIYIDNTIVDFTVQNEKIYIENCPNVFTIKIVKTGFNIFESTYNYKTLNNGNIGINPESQQEENQAYMLWTKSVVSDLDTHLQIFEDDSLLKEIYYNAKTYKNLYVNTVIDIDDTGADNGETTTITSLNDLMVDEKYTFKFIVLDWTNKNNSSSKKMSNSNAYVQITYKNQSHIINVPTDISGIYWEVFNIEKGTLKIINKVTTTNDQNIII